MPPFVVILVLWLCVNTIHYNVGEQISCGKVKNHIWRTTFIKPKRVHMFVLGGLMFPTKKNEALNETVMPWLVLVTLPMKQTCTGSLIASKFVLTAKHCTVRLKKDLLNHVVVSYGTFKKSDMYNVLVVDIIEHPNADLSILELEHDIMSTPVCLPKQYSIDSAIMMGMVVAGFGRYVPKGFTLNGLRNGTIIREKYGKIPEYAMWAYVNQQARSECKLKKSKEIKKTEFCAGALGSGTMDGDSGGPIMSIRKKHIIQVGVTSKGFSTAINNFIQDNGIYVNVENFSEWIKTVTKGTAQFVSFFDQ